MSSSDHSAFALSTRAPASPVERHGSVFERNLRALARSNAEIAARLRAVPPSRAQFAETPDEGALTATLDGRSLASRRRPLEEARRLAESVDIKGAGLFAVVGFGLGHHVGALARRVERTGIIVCCEPDLSLLRSVLERVDHSEWINATNLAIVSEPADAATLSTLIYGLEGLVAMGVRIVEHPSSAERLGPAAATFGDTVARVVAAVRTNVLTTMVQTSTTVRNLAMNADRYVAAPGIADLRDALAGRPAVVVSAGPSLARNIAELARPGMRDRVCLVAVQTALKPLLAAGVRPHFVVALDYHEISRRFYEGLTAADVEGVTLVVEPKANPAILDAWPGAVRMPRDQFLDTLLGPDLADPDRGAIRSGATVAHLAHYLARHLGCDPVALIGQDLGFTDGQYYAAGAAIHDVWAGDLNEFVSLELLEWQRIARNKPILRRAEDHLGRPVYTDEQMATYLAQFERDFLADKERGLRTVDATEGGVRKAHADAMSLRAFLAEFATSPIPPLPAPRRAPRDAANANDLLDRLREVRQGVWRVSRACRSTATVLAQMHEHHRDQARVNQLIAQAHQIADETRRITPAYELVQKFNQTGVFNRARDDRAIALDDLDPHGRQLRQIERDQRNMTWLGEAADALGDLLDSAANALRTGQRVTRDVLKADAASPARRTRPALTVSAVIHADLTTGSLGLPRDLAAPIAGVNALRRTVERLRRCERLRSIVVLASDPEAARSLLGDAASAVQIRAVEHADRVAPMVRAGRAWASSCWRSGLAGLTIFDELIDPSLAARALDDAGAHAALLVGADWPLLDPALCDAVIERHEESPEHHRLVFTQAAPGLCGCVIDRALLREIADARATAGPTASIGGLLAYNPRKPRADAIAKPICVNVDPSVRDLQRRVIADTPQGVARCAAALHATDAAAVAAALQRVDETAPIEALLHIDDATTPDAVATALRNAGSPSAVTIDARAMRNLAPLPTLAAAARSAGAARLHARVDLGHAPDDAAHVWDARPDVVSVDMHADSAERYAAVVGADAFPAALRALEWLANAAAQTPADRRPWIVPRMTKRDAVYEDVESFVDKWTLVFGHAALDPFEDAPPSERVRALPAPRSARERFARERAIVDLRKGAAR